MRGLPPPALVLTRPNFPWLTATVVLVVDAISKAVAQSRWTVAASSFGPFRLHVTENAGVSFSWLSSVPAVGIAMVLLTAAGVLIGSVHSRPGLPALAFGLILGGAVGNLADRFGSDAHRVVDFLGVGNLFVCNIADVAITFGVIVLGMLLLRGQSLTR